MIRVITDRDKLVTTVNDRSHLQASVILETRISFLEW